MTEIVRFERHGNIGVVIIANPPVNALSHGVRAGLDQAIVDTDQDSELEAVVLLCEGRTFIAGADIREFGKPPKIPMLGDVVFRIQKATKPWIAAVHGTALGGGLEIALGCHHRVATQDAKLGFSEVNLGLIPGAGGTILLPRVVAMKTALDMITRGKPVSATKALSDGLLDQVVEGDLKTAAIEFAEQLSDGIRAVPACERPIIEPLTDGDITHMREALLRKSRGQEAPVVAFDTTLHVATLPLDWARTYERKRFDELRVGSQSKALRHVFFAERSTSKIPEIENGKARAISQVGIVGGGTMGSGIAAACLLNGMTVVMVETSEDAAETGRERVAKILSDSLKRSLISEGAHGDMIASFSVTTNYDDLSHVDVVVEAVFEDLNVKKSVFEKLDTVTSPTAILATNTSYLDVNEIAGTVKDPSRVVGLHFFSPAHIMKLLEVIRPDEVASDVLATAFAFAKRLKKIPVLAGVCDGFIGNRIMSAYRREAEYLIEDGAMPDQVDRAMVDFGFPMGVFQMQDLAGLDIAWAMRKRQAATRDPKMRYVDIADRLCEQGNFGRKTGSGWYNYEGVKPFIDESVFAIIQKERRRKSIDPKTFSASDIIKRILGAMRAEAEEVLHEDIARHGHDIDVVMVNGYGFPRWKGGPMFLGQGDL